MSDNSEWSHYCILAVDEPIDHSMMHGSPAAAKDQAKKMLDAGEAECVYIYGTQLIMKIEPKGAEEEPVKGAA